jgi:hypothetical protein
VIILDTVNRSLNLVLGGAGVVPFIVSWVDGSTTTHVPAAAQGVTAGAVEVPVVPAPAAGFWRQIKMFLLQNSTGGAISVTIRYSDGATDRDFLFALTAGQNLQYSDGEGFRII